MENTTTDKATKNGKTHDTETPLEGNLKHRPAVPLSATGPVAGPGWAVCIFSSTLGGDLGRGTGM